MSALIDRLDSHINTVASRGGNPAATLAELRLLLEARSRILALESTGRDLLAIADRVNDVTHAGQPAQSDELADRLYALDMVVSGAAPHEPESQKPLADRDNPVEFISRRREMLRRASS